MKCEDIKELLALYAGGELASDEIAAVESHISSCNACADEAEEYKTISNRLATLKEEPAADGLWEDMWSGVKEGIGREKKTAQFDVILRYAAMLLLGLGIGFFGYIFNKPIEAVANVAPVSTETFAQRRAPSENAVAGNNRWVLPGNEICPVDSNLGVAVANAPEGIKIKGIQEGGIAQNILRLQPNDIVIKFDQNTIKDLDSLRKVVDKISKTGKMNMTLTVVRNGKVTNLNITGSFGQRNR